jgi:hypothetical protein
MEGQVLMQVIVAFFVLGAGAVAAWGLLMGPIGKAIARWIEARTPNAQGQLMADLAEIEARVTRLERLLRESTNLRGSRSSRGRPD